MLEPENIPQTTLPFGNQANVS